MFELKCKEHDRVRDIYERFVILHPNPKYWIKYARFEEAQNCIDRARRIYQRAISFFGDWHLNQGLFIAFAKFEENQDELKHAHDIFRYAINRMEKDDYPKLYEEYEKHKETHGDECVMDDSSNEELFDFNDASNNDGNSSNNSQTNIMKRFEVDENKEFAVPVSFFFLLFISISPPCSQP